MGASILGTVALVVAALMTLLVVGSTGMFTMRKPSGPDSMGLAGPFFAAVFAWALTAVAAGIGAGRGALGWVTDSTPAAVILALAAMVGVGGAAVVGVGFSFETRYAWRTPVGVLAGFVAPAVAILFVGATLWIPAARLTTEAWPRVFGYTFAVIAALSWIVAGVMYARHMQAQERRYLEREAEYERQRQENAADAKRRDAEHAARLAAMSDETPLREFLTHLFIDKSDEHHARAIARIGSLPRVNQRIEELLTDPTPIQREYCLNYIRVNPATPDPALAPAVGRAIVLLAQDIERATPSGEMHHVKGMTEGALMTAGRFSVRFESEVAQLRAALEKWPCESTRDAAVELVDAYMGKVGAPG